MRACWDAKLVPWVIAFNLLVCRLERGIERDRTARAILKAVRPKIASAVQRMAKAVRAFGSIVTDDFTADLESVIITSLLSYKMGERTPPLRWLFGGRKGAVPGFVSKRLREIRSESWRMQHLNLDSEDYAGSDMDYADSAVVGARNVMQRAAQLSVLTIAPIEFDEAAADRADLAKIFDVLDDGMTLSSDEHRVVSYCLAHLHDDGRHATSGLHLELAQKMKISRASVTALYGRGLRRLVKASGLARRYFRARGLDQPARKSTVMTPVEIRAMLALHRERTIAMQDLTWLYNITEEHARRLIKEFDPRAMATTATAPATATTTYSPHPA